MVRALVVLGLTALAGAAAGAEPRTVRIGGKTVKLTVAEDVLLVRPENAALARPPAAAAPAAAAWQANTKAFLKGVVAEQGKFTKDKRPPQVALAEVEANRPRAVPQMDALLVPRAADLQAGLVTRLTAAPGVKAATPVYRINGALLIPRRSVTVRFKGPPPADVVADLVERYKLKEVARPKFLPDAVQLELQAPDKADAFATAELIERHLGDKAEWAEPDLIHEVRKYAAPPPAPPPPDDPHVGRQWYLDRIQAPKFWAAARPRAEVLVAVVDDGVDAAHPDLAGRVAGGRNFVSLGRGVPADPEAWRPQGEDDNHGTPCAGLVAAVAGNGKGVAGIGRGVKVLAVRVTGEGRLLDEDEYAAAFAWAHDQGARVVSCSLGFDGETRKIRDVLRRVADAGRLVVAAAGNSGQDVGFPASMDGVVGVGAVRKDDEAWAYSCRGPDKQVTLVAPSGITGFLGEQGVWSTDRVGKYGLNRQDHVGGWLPGEKELVEMEPEKEFEQVGDAGGDYTGRFGGTSAAAPMVAAVAATIWACHPDLTAAQVRRALVDGADVVRKNDPFAGWENGYSKVYGYGRLNAAAALDKAAAMTPPKADPKPADPPAVAAGRPPALYQVAAAEPPPKVIQALFKPVPVTWTADGQTVRADPSDRWVTVCTPNGPDEARAALAHVVRPGALDDRGFAPLYEPKDGSFALYKVARVDLKGKDELTRAAQDGKLPVLYPCYESASKGPVVFRGTVVVEPAAGQTADEVAKVAAEVGLTPTGNAEAGRREFRLTSQAQCLTPADAARELVAKGKVKSARPDLLTQVKR